MICEKCKAEGQTSTVYVNPWGTATLMADMPYYDEQGNYHRHDPNWHGNEGHCSRGHRFARSYLPKCPSCDYGEEKITWYERQSP
jgi:hypothetical protein